MTFNKLHRYGLINPSYDLVSDTAVWHSRSICLFILSLFRQPVPFLKFGLFPKDLSDSIEDVQVIDMHTLIP